ncbi:M1 family metallopeptidase [Mucilaginibacter segetis]|uniref:M1 family metallopeptidase n=1 Tax=Mucilaginibacter segetis TaxID=2793071 RepID=A0A934PTZ6_9SPHI|nr:M1 family metallopeptidase [Mucilaginibacter segetis]MBK0378973.1 M1 family metallopeptidase [Mucilaginibacter segetis]
MFKSFLISAALFIFVTQANAQEIVNIPRDIQKAYNNKTRSMDGKPGPKYWQNTSNYIISVTVMPPDRTVKGVEEITYFNNSPDTLKQLNMKLILNVHRAGATRFRATTPDYITSGIQVDSIFADGQKKPWDNEKAHLTNYEVRLSKPLLPHSSIKLNITWHYELATGAGREGVIDPSTFYIAYFYPRVAVYDDYNGWDKLEFNDRQEFYNDFNNYTLNVTVPKNYIVWATGTLQNPQQVLQPEYAKKLQTSLSSDSVIHIVTQADIAKNNITAQNETNTWIWKADNISDMAFGISNHYDWDGASVVVDDATGRRASMQAAYNDTSPEFHQSVKFGLHSLDYFSHNWPGVPYPFPKMTAFEGFADMEFPMMVNDSHDPDLADAQLLQDHEMAHTYFPFYMGINETRFGYMDEGWATTFEHFINETEVGKEKAQEVYKKFRIAGWMKDYSETEDLPLITPTSELKDGYAHNAYGKASLSYLALKDLLGDEMFKEALHAYMNNWHGKHPIPWDYFNSINTATGQNLNWFFNNWFFTYSYIDLAIKNVTKIGMGYKIVIDNIGGFAIPFDVKLTYSDGTTGTIHMNPAIWKTNQKQAIVNLKNNKTVVSVAADGGIFIDADNSNNTFKVKKA